MKIIVKPEITNVISINNCLKKGADAFLFGIKDLSINISPITIIRLKEIKKAIGDRAEIFVSLDKNFSNKDLDLLKKTLLKIEELNINGIMFYDLAVLNIHQELNLTTPLVWNQNFMVNNYETIKYYYQKKIETVVVSQEITTDEITEIKNNTLSKLIVNIFGYPMMSFSKRKLVSNYFKYFEKPKTKNKYLILDEKSKNQYPIVETKEGTMIYNHNILNGIMEINKLKEINVEYVLLTEQLINHNKFLEILGIYSEIIKENLDDAWARSKNLEIQKLIDNLDDGFFNKKTIFKVK